MHDYLTVDGRKISKSAVGPGLDSTALDSTDPVALATTYGADALRWWLLRDVPRVGDADFTVDKLIGRANADLANGLGNLISRVVSLVHSHRNGVVRSCSRPLGTSRWLANAADGRPVGPLVDDWPADAIALRATIERTPASVKAALARFDFRAGASAVWEIVEQANRYVEATEPWHLAKAEQAGDVVAGKRLDQVLGALVAACQVVAAEIWPFLPTWPQGGGRLQRPRREAAEAAAGLPADRDCHQRSLGRRNSTLPRSRWLRPPRSAAGERDHRRRTIPPVTDLVGHPPPVVAVLGPSAIEA